MKPIVLNEKWRIERGNYSWELVFSEVRKRNSRKTKKDEDYTFEERWYYPDIKMLCDRIVTEELTLSGDTVLLIGELTRIYKLIKSLENTIFKPTK